MYIAYSMKHGLDATRWLREVVRALPCSNTNLLADVDVDENFSEAMEAMVPGFRRVQGKEKVLGLSPGANVTWHHVPGSARWQLVWRYQHEQTKGLGGTLYGRPSFTRTTAVDADGAQ